MNGLLIARDGALVRLTLNRPEALNALDVDSAQALLGACREIQQDTSVRAVLLAGSGRAFAAGGDLAQMRPDPVRVADALIGPLHEALAILATIDAWSRRTSSHPKPTHLPSASRTARRSHSAA